MGNQCCSSDKIVIDAFNTRNEQEKDLQVKQKDIGEQKNVRFDLLEDSNDIMKDRQLKSNSLDMRVSTERIQFSREKSLNSSDKLFNGTQKFQLNSQLIQNNTQSIHNSQVQAQNNLLTIQNSAQLNQFSLQITQNSAQLNQLSTNIFQNSVYKIQSSRSILQSGSMRIIINADKIQKTILNYKSSNLSRIKAHFLTSDQNYEDPDFIPSIEQITQNINEFQIAQNITWKRVNQILPEKQIKVFEGEVEPSDIYQGYLGDCYFLSALSTLAEYPTLITRLFDVEEYNPSGFYSVWMNHDGIWKQIIIDDYFPCIGDTFAFSKSNGPELWVVILEKVYAKVFKNYNNISAGFSEQAVTDLTGSPHDWKFIQNVDETWEYIYSKIEDEKINSKVKYILNAASNSEYKQGIEKSSDKGIVSGHAYAILDAKIVNTKNGEERIVKLRNPWGKSEWTGPWSDKSDKWTEELKKLCDMKDENDGQFWMAVEDFCKKYSTISCNYLHVQNLYNSQSVISFNSKLIHKLNFIFQSKIDLSKGDYALVQFKTTHNETSGYIQFHQKDKRNFKGVNDSYDYSQVRMLIFSGNPKQIGQYIGEVSSFGRSGYVQVNLKKKGQYFIIVCAQWENNVTRELVISSYTDKEVYFNNETQYVNELSFLDECLLKVPLKQQSDQHTYEQDNLISRYSNSCFGYFYFVYQNNSTTSFFSEELKMYNVRHLKICQPYTNSNKFEVELEPQKHVIIKYKIQPGGNGQFGYSFRFTNKFKLSSQNLIDKILLTESNKRPRKINGADSQVFFYSMFYDGGCAFYLQNKTNQTYFEKLQLKVVNLISEDGIDTSSTLRIQLPPNTGQLLKFKEINENVRASYKISYLAKFTD